MRITQNINKCWQFRKGGQFPDQYGLHDEEWQEVNLPHTWNAFDGQDGGNDYFRGKGIYMKRLHRPDVPADYQIYLEFEGVNSVAEIFLDGQKVMEHRGGYSTFRVNITDAIADGTLMLTVVADNRNFPDVYPQMADFTFYGGIYRNVNLIAVPKTHFSLDFYGSCGLAFDSKINDNLASVFLAAWISNPQSFDLVQFSIMNEDESVIAETTTTAKEMSAAAAFILNPHLWQGVCDPYLYTVTARIIRGNECIDEVESFLGIREFSVDPEKGFFLNGIPTPLRGVSRHQDKLGLGNALSDDDHWEDAGIIAELGANTVRLAHYQHNQTFYDACDAYGFVVWAEIPFISLMNKDPKAHENCREQLKELIYQNYNHPSICFWGISNEITIGGDIPGLLSNLHDLNKLVKELDPTRLTTMAQVSMLPKDSAHNQITDTVSYNHYFGWYGGSYNQNEEWFDHFHEMYPDRPFGISEYGCEGIINWHSNKPKCRDYTEEYQAEYHEHMAKIISERPYLWATHVWNMFDFGCDARDEGGVKGRNNKGLVTFDRKIKKDAYFIYKAYWSIEPFVHITGRRYAFRPQNPITIKIYSNQDQVTLFVNGKEFGTQHGNKIFLFKDVPISREGTCITACTPAGCCDNVTFRYTETSHPEYQMPAEEESERDGAKNWFEDVDARTVAPDLTFKDGYFSIRDTIGELLQNEQASDVMVSAINQFSPMKVKKTMLGMMSGVTLEDMCGMFGEPEAAERMMKFMNAGLQEVPKNKTL